MYTLPILGYGFFQRWTYIFNIILVFNLYKAFEKLGTQFYLLLHFMGLTRAEVSKLKKRKIM